MREIVIKRIALLLDCITDTKWLVCQNKDGINFAIFELRKLMDLWEELRIKETHDER